MSSAAIFVWCFKVRAKFSLSRSKFFPLRVAQWNGSQYPLGKDSVPSEFSIHLNFVFTRLEGIEEKEGQRIRRVSTTDESSEEDELTEEQKGWIIVKNYVTKSSEKGIDTTRDKTTHRHGFLRQFTDKFEDSSLTLFEDNPLTLTICD